jgi:hypothetical protein
MRAAAHPGIRFVTAAGSDGTEPPAPLIEAPILAVASAMALRSTNMKPRLSPVTEACAAETASPVARGLAPFVSTAALTESRSPTSATLPSRIV